MDGEETDQASLSPWWRHATILVMILRLLAAVDHHGADLHQRAADPAARRDGASARPSSTGQAILRGQEVFLKYGLMDNGTLWGHGAYLGPDYTPSTCTAGPRSPTRCAGAIRPPTPRCSAEAATPPRRRATLKQNRYDAATGTLPSRAARRRRSTPAARTGRTTSAGQTPTAGCRPDYITDPAELRAARPPSSPGPPGPRSPTAPGKDYSYTNNFPYDPLVGNRPTGSTLLWSALSLIRCSAASARCCSPSASSTTSAGSGDEDAGALPRSRSPGLEADAEPVGAGEVLRRRGAAVPAAGAARRRRRPLPRRARRLLRLRPGARSCPATCCAPGICSSRSSGSPPPMSPARCSSRRSSARARAARAARRRRTCCSARSSSSSVGSLLGEWARHHQPARRPVVLARQPGLGVSGARPRSGRSCSRSASCFWFVLLFGALRPARCKTPERAELASLFLYRRARRSRSSTCRRCSSAPTPTSRSSTPGASGSSTCGSKASSSCSPR